MKDKLNKALDFIKKYKLAFSVGVAIAVVLIVVLIIVAVSGASDDEQGSRYDWGEGVTDGIPEFSAKTDSVNVSSKHAAAYYSEITSEQVNEYIALVEKECGVKFEGEKYPRSAVLEDKIIVIHYNVTEMNFSVTVAAKGDIANTASGD